MALVQVDFFSEKLMRTVTINAIIPVDKKLNQPNKKFKTLYLLHGIFGNYTDWVCGTRIQRWAQDHDLAVIMPSGENKFYVDNENSHEYYSQFIGEELVSITRAMFPLSQRREDTFIAGLSMGGYGAIINGLKYYQTFGYIAALSSALLIDTFINAIFLYDDKMVITFNYNEGTTTITFDDLKSALADQKTGSDLDCSTAPAASCRSQVANLTLWGSRFLLPAFQIGINFVTLTQTTQLCGIFCCAVRHF